MSASEKLLLVVIGAAITLAILSIVRWQYSKKLEDIIDTRIKRFHDKRDNENQV